MITTYHRDVANASTNQTHEQKHTLAAKLRAAVKNRLWVTFQPDWFIEWQTDGSMGHTWCVEFFGIREACAEDCMRIDDRRGDVAQQLVRKLRLIARRCEKLAARIEAAAAVKGGDA